MARILVGQWLETVVAEYTSDLTHSELWLLPKASKGRLLRRWICPFSDERVSCNMLLRGVATEITVAVWGGTTPCISDSAIGNSCSAGQCW